MLEKISFNLKETTDVNLNDLQLKDGRSDLQWYSLNL